MNDINSIDLTGMSEYKKNALIALSKVDVFSIKYDVDYRYSNPNYPGPIDVPIPVRVGSFIRIEGYIGEL